MKCYVVVVGGQSDMVAASVYSWNATSPATLATSPKCGWHKRGASDMQVRVRIRQHDGVIRQRPTMTRQTAVVSSVVTSQLTTTTLRQPAVTARKFASVSLSQRHRPLQPRDFPLLAIDHTYTQHGRDHGRRRRRCYAIGAMVL